jgi:hypothetical protein
VIPAPAEKGKLPQSRTVSAEAQTQQQALKNWRGVSTNARY